MIPEFGTSASNNIEHTTQLVSNEELPQSSEESDFLEDIVNLSIEKSNNYSIEKPDIAFIECTSRAALLEQNSVNSIETNLNNNDGQSELDKTVTEGLTDEEKNKIKEETGWSDDIIDCIQNMKQYEILKNAGLIEVEINGRKCLIKENIELDYTDADGISNRDRLARGLAPLDSKTGKPIELHHLGQKADSPLVELTEEEHRTGEYEEGKKNQSLWHNNSLDTEVHGDGNTWTQERKAHWKERSAQSSGGTN
ncbi:MAG: HNH/ENDO VII family nuclease [Aeromonas sp.]|uniref:HNH/ENDO VII family nuclease n=1 Tax=Aeromonas sp. TaxID=647 RepID=UPI002FCC05E3